MTILERLSRSYAVKIALTLAAYAFYAAVLGVSLTPSGLLVAWAWQRFVPGGLGAGSPGIVPILLVCLFIGAAAWVFFFFGLLVMGSLIRLLSLGVKPGRHDAASLPVLLWMVLSGVFTLAWRIILPLVLMTPFSEMFHRLTGCRIGKNVWINTIHLIDGYMVSIGDNTVIGGEAVISPHLFENGKLHIEPIVIGKDCLIGGHAYISPGVTVGDGSVIGMKAYVRRGRKLPPGSRVTSVAAVPLSRARDIEHDAGTGRRRGT